MQKRAVLNRFARWPSPFVRTLEATVVAPDAASFKVHGLHVAALVRCEVHDGVVLKAELPEGVHQRPDALVHLLYVVAVAGTGGWYGELLISQMARICSLIR